MKYKIEFLNHAILEENTDSKDDKIKLPFVLYTAIQCRINEREFIIPAGFKTDLASIPVGLRWFCDAFGVHNKAAILHDILYAAELLPRGMADDIFSAALVVCGLPQWKANIMWAAVRTCGGLTYATEHTIERIKKIRGIAHCIPATLMRPLWRTVAEIKQ